MKLPPARKVPTCTVRCTPLQLNLARLSGIALAMAVLHSPAIAADYLWKGNWGDWDDANQWTLLGVPGAGNSAELAGGGSWISAARSVGSLALTGGQLWGDGALTTGSLNFQRGALGGGGQASTYPTGFTTVTGTTVFNGANSQAIADNHTLTLQGDSSWTAGTGAIAGTPYGGIIVNNGTWTDFGTGSTAPGSYKSLRSDPAGGGGSFVNNGTYVRTGLGTTRAYGFSNAGLLQLSAGRLAVDGNFSNAGEVRIDAGAVLASVSNTFQNDGLISGTGTIRTNSLSQSLVNAGTLTPGGLGSTGSLLLDGDLAMAANGALRIDLAGGQHDLLTITSDASFAGDLQLWAAPGTALQVGDSFVVATYGQRLAGSTFGSVQWLGAGANPFSVEYGVQALTLHVTSAVPVPEPGTGLLWLGGILALAGVAARRRHQTSRLHS